MPFSEDDAVELASATKEAQAFEAKHPDCVWNVEKMKPKDVETWIKKHPKVTGLTTKPTPPKALWLVEIEELDTEKLVIVISPETKKVADITTEKLEAEVEEEEEEEAEAADEEE